MLDSVDVVQYQLPTFKVRLGVFLASFVLIYSLQLAHYLAHSPGSPSLTIQLSISLPGLLTVLFTLPGVILWPRIRLLLVCVMYLAAVVAFSALDFDLHNEQDYKTVIPAFFPTLALLPSLQGVTYYRTPIVLVLAITAGLVNLGFTAAASEAAYPLFSFGIYLLSSLSIVHNCYLTEIRTRKDYSNSSTIQPNFRRQATIHPELQEGTVGTELEIVIGQLWKVQSYIKDAVFVAKNAAEKDRASKFVTVIREILMKLRSKNLYEVTAENIPRDWDVDESKYVKENYVSQIGPLIELKRESEVHPTIPKSLKSSVKSLIPLFSQIGSQWNIDTDSLCVWAAGKPISNVATYLFKSFHLHRTVPFRKQALVRVFTEMENRYLDNPYHNSTHATDVTVSIMYLVKASGLLTHTTDLEIAAFITASLGHDVAHPGVNNRFLQNSKDKLALECNFHLDNDFSVLEMMHLSVIFNIFQTTNASEDLSLDVWLTFRKIVIEMVLATDMAKHFELVGMIRAMIAPVKMEDAGTRLFLFRMMLKCADIGHAAKTWELHERWSLRIVEEFFKQGDAEKSKGLPVSMYCDRATTDISKVHPTQSQKGFLDNIAFPLFSSLSDLLQSDDIHTDCVQQIENNAVHWTRRQKKRAQTQQINTEKVEMKHRYRTSESRLKAGDDTDISL